MSYFTGRTWAVLVFSAVMLAAVGLLATWWWRSLGYVSTDDARVRAEIVTISAEISGRIKSITKGEGDTVTPGEVMVLLDTSEILIQIEHARAEMDGARSRLLQVRRQIQLHMEKQRGETVQAKATLRRYRHNHENARVHEELAREDFQRAQELFKRNLISAQTLGHAKTELRQAEAKLSAFDETIREGEAVLELIRIKGREVTIKEADFQAWEAEVRKAQARLADLERKLRHMTIRSAVGGVVVKKYSHEGEFVQQGQPIFMVVDSTRFWVEANVDETEIRFVKPGSRAEVKIDSYPDREFIGKVTEIGGATVSEFSLFSPQKLTGVFIKSTQRFPVKVVVENTDGLLKVGMLAVVWIKKDSQ